MKVLVVGSMQWEMYSPAFINGLKFLGNTVAQFDTSSYAYKGSRRSIPNRILARYHIGIPILRMNNELLKLADEFRPDLIFFYYCLDFYKSTYLKLKAKGFMMFTYCNDDPFGVFLNKPWCHKFHDSLPIADWNFVYRRKNLMDYQSVGVDKVSMLYPYYLEGKNKCLNLERDIPVAFAGHFEDDGRDELVLYSLNKGVPLTIFNGSYWQKSRYYEQIKDAIKPSACGEEYNRLINRMQIAVVFLSKLNHDTYTRRCFELPATKTLMLCEYTDDMNRLFPEDDCAVYFRNKEDFVEKCTNLLAHPDVIARIAQNGYDRLRQIGGSEVDRCREIVTKYEEIQHNRHGKSNI